MWGRKADCASRHDAEHSAGARVRPPRRQLPTPMKVMTQVMLATAALAVLNDRLSKLPTSICVMFGGFVVRLLLLVSLALDGATSSPHSQECCSPML